MNGSAAPDLRGVLLEKTLTALADQLETTQCLYITKIEDPKYDLDGKRVEWIYLYVRNHASPNGSCSERMNSNGVRGSGTDH